MVTVIIVIIGILLGMSFAGGLAYLVSSIILMKSNDFGNTKADIKQYTGYDDIEIINEGQVNGPNSPNGAFTPKGFW